MVLGWILGAVILDSLISLVGAFTLVFKRKWLDKVMYGMVGFATGALLGAAFLDLLPEAAAHGGPFLTYALIGFMAFFVLERFLNWHHCHGGKKEKHTHAFSYLILFGDAVHNILDGAIIATSFLVSIPLGVVATLAILLHEIPQELGDFAILVYGGFKPKKALFYNFLAQLTCIVGALAAYYLSSTIEGFTTFLIPFAAGNFLYIAATDLIPELNKEQDLKRSAIQFVFLVVGILLIAVAQSLFGAH
ncbi:MAG: ZIP family metal transporter [Nanoarchaeota archaeon]